MQYNKCEGGNVDCRGFSGEIESDLSATKTGYVATSLGLTAARIKPHTFLLTRSMVYEHARMQMNEFKRGTCLKEIVLKHYSISIQMIEVEVEHDATKKEGFSILSI